MMTPVYMYIGETLELHFPTRIKRLKEMKEEKAIEEEVFSISNVIIKMILSETVIGAVTNSLVVIYLGLLDGEALGSLSTLVQQRVPEMMSNSRKFWPMVTLCRFTIIPPKHHGIFNNTVGFLWSIYSALTMN